MTFSHFFDHPLENPPKLNFRFLTQLKLRRLSIVDQALTRELCLCLVGGCPDVETLVIEFPEKAWFFSDIFLDDILVGISYIVTQIISHSYFSQKIAQFCNFFSDWLIFYARV